MSNMKKELVIKIGAGVVTLLALTNMVLNIVCLNKISENKKQISELKEELSDLEEQISEFKAEMKEKTDLYDEMWESQVELNEKYLELFNIIQDVLFV